MSASAKPDYPNSIPGPHVVEGKHQKLSSNLHTQATA